MLRVVHDAAGSERSDAAAAPILDLNELCQLAAREMQGLGQDPSTSST